MGKSQNRKKSDKIQYSMVLHCNNYNRVNDIFF